MMAMERIGGPRNARPVDPLTGCILTPEKPATADQPKDFEGDVGSGDGRSTSRNSSLHF